MDFVIDIQGFRDVGKHFLPKEVAVIALQELIVGHWVTAPPCNFLQLSSDIQRTNNYCTVYLHGIQWFEGDVSLRCLRHHLYKIVRKAKNIYVRGEEKQRYLEGVFGRCVINLEQWRSPSFDKLETAFPNSMVCAYHMDRVVENNKDFCALYKANLLRRWLHSILPEEWRKVDEKNIQSERFHAALRQYRDDRRKGNLRFGEKGGLDEVDNTSSCNTVDATIESDDDDDDDPDTIVFNENAPIENPIQNNSQNEHKHDNERSACFKSEYNRCICC